MGRWVRRPPTTRWGAAPHPPRPHPHHPSELTQHVDTATPNHTPQSLHAASTPTADRAHRHQPTRRTQQHTALHPPSPPRHAHHTHHPTTPDTMTITRDSRAWRTLKKRVLTQARQTKPPCAACGLPINYQTRNPNADNAPSVDHIRPWRDHPNLRLDPANLRVIHQACNRAKGTTTHTPSLGNTSRQWGHTPTTNP